MSLPGLGNGELSQLAAESIAQILEPVTPYTELPIPITLIAALSKNGFDQVVWSCPELNVTAIIPPLSDRHLLKPRTRGFTRRLGQQ